MAFTEYIWLDGSAPTPQLRSRTRLLSIVAAQPGPADFPEWGFDGSVTGQSGGGECVLKPVRVFADPTRAGEHYLVLCEVLNADGTEHTSNSRGKLRSVLASFPDAHDARIGFAQQYTLMRDGRPLGFPKDGHSVTQGPHYCGVGADRAFGRDIAEAHAQLCAQAGLMICGFNAEVLPGQWEFQIGYRGGEGEDASLLNAADHLWLARYLLQRVAEARDVVASLACKPVKGECNSSGLHTRFSTGATRDEGGIAAIYAAIERLARAHDPHIDVYGESLDPRSMARVESPAMFDFDAADAGRGASIRVPLSVERKGRGYFEDRRPGANAEPYQVAARLVATVLGGEDTLPAGMKWAA